MGEPWLMKIVGNIAGNLARTGAWRKAFPLAPDTKTDNLIVYQDRICPL
jgi:hypothetical protein